MRVTQKKNKSDPYEEINKKWKKVLKGKLSSSESISKGEEYYSNGEQHYKNNEFQQAIDDYTSAIETFDDGPLQTYHLVATRGPLAMAYARRGASYLIIDSLDRGLDDFEKAIYYNPKDKYSFLGRGSIFLSKAIDDFEKGCDLGDEMSCKFFGLLKTFKKQ